MDFDGYLKWTLYNVLSRHTRIDTIGSNYNVNPVDTGVNTCTSIHKNKAQLVFNKNISDIIIQKVDKSKKIQDLKTDLGKIKDDPKKLAKVMDFVKTLVE